jgi:hypothetical protein
MANRNVFAIAGTILPVLYGIAAAILKSTFGIELPHLF